MKQFLHIFLNIDYPKKIKVSSQGPAAMKQYYRMGDFNLLDGLIHNGRPVWKHVTRVVYLFHGKMMHFFCFSPFVLISFQGKMVFGTSEMTTQMKKVVILYLLLFLMSLNFQQMDGNTSLKLGFQMIL